jgi:hypothetical protein
MSQVLVERNKASIFVLFFDFDQLYSVPSASLQVLISLLHHTHPRHPSIGYIGRQHSNARSMHAARFYQSTGKPLVAQNQYSSTHNFVPLLFFRKQVHLFVIMTCHLSHLSETAKALLWYNRAYTHKATTRESVRYIEDEGAEVEAIN